MPPTLLAAHRRPAQRRDHRPRLARADDRERRRVEGRRHHDDRLGFGDDFDEELLLQVADAGRGNAHYAPAPEAALGIFAKEFKKLVSLVARNVSVGIRPSDEVQVSPS